MTVMIMQWQYLLGCLLASGVGVAFGYWLALLILIEPLQYELRLTKAQLARQNRRLESVQRPSPEESFRHILNAKQRRGEL